MEEGGDLRGIRLRKLEAIRARGELPYKYSYLRTHSTSQVREEFGKVGHDPAPAEVRLAGRVLTSRHHGKTGFADLEDRSGRLQLYFKQDLLGPQSFGQFLELDRGDLIGVSGRAFRTKKGELTLQVSAWELLAKSLHPLPEKFHGLKDIELRYRQRYADLIVNPAVRETFIQRSRLIAYMRRYLDERGYVEVETPVLQPLYGGALARPFKTHHRYLDQDFYLRIATELYLKRLIVGGLEKVYEIGKDFRNEDIDAQHNPEFTMLECYEAYTDYEGMLALTQGMIVDATRELLGSFEVPYGDKTLHFTPPWPRMSMLEAVRKTTGVDFDDFKTDAEARVAAREAGLEKITEDLRWGEVLAEWFEQKVQPTLLSPTFITEYPVEVSPLAKLKRGDPRFVERFELFINGWEIANAFSELNDPLEQRARFEDQEAKRERGHEEAHQVDEDYVRALEYGMPPTGGLGIGVDRVAMILTSSPSIKDVILFPHMRPEKSG